MAKLERKRSCSYLYADGTLVVLFEESRGFVKIGETADVHYGWAKASFYADSHAQKAENARAVISRYEDSYAQVMKGGRVEFHEAALHHGSKNTQARSIAVQHIKLRTKQGLELCWHDFPALMSPVMTIQIGEQYAVKTDLHPGDWLWTGVYVSKVTGLKSEVA